MIELSRILCPVDLSEPSRRALDHAVAVARWYGSAITVLRVIPPVVPLIGYSGEPYYLPPALSAADLEQVRRATERFAARESGGPPMETLVVQGDVADQIDAHAGRLGAGLIVLGTHGHRGFERLMLGSVTERVLRTTSCPVLTVPPAAPDAVPARAGLFTRILCGVDFSPASMRALQFAASIAKEADAHLTAVHVIEHPSPWPLPAGTRDMASLNKTAEAAARERLHAAIADDVREYARVEEVVAEGKAYTAILDLARAAQADLIVIGAHEGGAPLRALGSTTNHIVRAAACPVLTLRGAPASPGSVA
jgi:nucleotide-binding universal stress UspA family protein